MRTSNYDPEKLTMLLVKHHWRKQEFVWGALSARGGDAADVRAKGGQFEWWNRGPDSLLVYLQDGTASIFTPRANIARYIVERKK